MIRIDISVAACDRERFEWGVGEERRVLVEQTTVVDPQRLGRSATGVTQNRTASTSAVCADPRGGGCPAVTDAQLLAEIGSGGRLKATSGPGGTWRRRTA